MYKCSLCNYTSNLKRNITRHNNKKNKCGFGEFSIVQIIDEFSCEFCKKSLTTSRSLTRHMTTCKVKKCNVEKELAIKTEKIKELEKENEILKAVAKKPSIVINNNLNLTSYNNPNLKDIEKFFSSCIKKQFMCIPKLIELIHFNSELPENHNLLLTNFRSDMMRAYNGNKWQTVGFEEITNELIGNYERDLQDWAGEDLNKVKYLDKWNKIKIRDGEEVVYKDLQQELRKLMYDNRGIVKIK